MKNIHRHHANITVVTPTPAPFPCISDPSKHLTNTSTGQTSVSRIPSFKSSQITTNPLESCQVPDLIQTKHACLLEVPDPPTTPSTLKLKRWPKAPVSEEPLGMPQELTSISAILQHHPLGHTILTAHPRTIVHNTSPPNPPMTHPAPFKSTTPPTTRS